MVRLPTIDIVIVDFNAGEFVRDCIASMELHPPRAARIDRVVLVDNASASPTSGFLRPTRLPVSIIRNERNLGFAAACNQGARGSTADYILFLNPDTELRAGSLDVPAEFMEDPDNADVGIAGIQLLDDTGRVSRTCSHHPRPSFFFNKALGLERVAPSSFPSGMMLDWDHSTSSPVDNVIGAFFFVRRTVFEQLSGFDERFFVYFEETDFGYRSSRAGYRTIYLTGAQAIHAGCGSSDSVRARRLVYSMQSRMEYARLHFSWPAATLVALLTLVVEPVTRLLYGIFRGATSDVRETLTAYRQLWTNRATNAREGS
jgi:N-acetylglucosaminyl-diphospho-decaprenol L-rhamnosyltransferase